MGLDKKHIVVLCCFSLLVSLRCRLVWLVRERMEDLMSATSSASVTSCWARASSSSSSVMTAAVEQCNLISRSGHSLDCPPLPH